MPLETTGPRPPRPSLRWVRAPRTGRGRARGAPERLHPPHRIAQSSGAHRRQTRERLLPMRRKHRRHARLWRRPALVSPRTSRRCSARAYAGRPQRGRNVSKTDAKVVVASAILLIPYLSHDNQDRGVATRIDQERNPQVSGAFQRSPQVTESARLDLSRWRHGFEPRWDYKEKRRSDPCPVGVASQLSRSSRICPAHDRDTSRPNLPAVGNRVVSIGRASRPTEIHAAPTPAETLLSRSPIVVLGGV